jgi:hypothetical protein
MPEQDEVIAPPVATEGSPWAAGPSPQSPTAICREVERVVTREPLDRVKCSHLFGDYYRCNWWSRILRPKTSQDYDWASTLTDHVRQSRFLRVIVGPTGLDVQSVAARSSGPGAG